MTWPRPIWGGIPAQNPLIHHILDPLFFLGPIPHFPATHLMLVVSQKKPKCSLHFWHRRNSIGLSPVSPWGFSHQPGLGPSGTRPETRPHGRAGLDQSPGPSPRRARSNRAPWGSQGSKAMEMAEPKAPRLWKCGDMTMKYGFWTVLASWSLENGGLPIHGSVYRIWWFTSGFSRPTNTRKQSKTRVEGPKYMAVIVNNVGMWLVRNAQSTSTHIDSGL